MIALACRWGDSSWLDASRIAASLGLFAGGPAASLQTDGALCAFLESPRGAARRGWRVARTPSGRPVLFEGWIDNARDIAARLDHDATDPAQLYGAAVEAWGDDADRQIHGSYAAIIHAADGTVRLSRGAWSAQPLFWAGDETAMVAASIIRPLFAAGFPKRPLPDLAAALLGGVEHDGAAYFYEGVRAVPDGAIVRVGPGGADVRRWYDVAAIAPVRLANDKAYEDAAAALLADACAAALKPAARPGILLSGGLDSAIIADEMLRQMPDGQTLRSFTSVDSVGGDDHAEAAMFADEQSRVRAFAAEHPRLEAHFVDQREAEFDVRLNEMFVAADTAHGTLGITANYRAAMGAAKDARCDWLFVGDYGNQTFSSDGRWAFAEFLRSGRWAQLWAMLRDHPGDTRAMPRRVLARSILPQFPAALRKAVRRAVHPGGETPWLIRPEAAERLGIARRREAAIGRPDGEWPSSRRAAIGDFRRTLDMGNELHHAHEQVYGFRMRAVPLYRPLVEFCLAIPTDQFVRDGEQRWLARRLARGRMPEAQRTARDYGQHNADWHARLTPRLGELRREVDAIADDPELRQVIDIDRARALLDDWPTRPPVGTGAQQRWFNALSAVVIAGRFARYLDGRNVR